MKLSAQLKNNSLAIISLVVALSTLSYNTWRNELTEQNRNTRTAGFEMLLHIGELQRITYLAHFENDMETVSPRRGETEVLVLKDLARLMPDSVQQQATTLVAVWRDNWRELGSEDDMAVAMIDNAINDLRIDVLRALDALE